MREEPATSHYSIAFRYTMDLPSTIPDVAAGSCCSSSSDGDDDHEVPLFFNRPAALLDSCWEHPPEICSSPRMLEGDQGCIKGSI